MHDIVVNRSFFLFLSAPARFQSRRQGKPHVKPQIIDNEKLELSTLSTDSFLTAGSRPRTKKEAATRNGWE